MDLDLNLTSGRVRARRWGVDNAPLLLCVHGLSANLSAFTYIAEQLASTQRQVVAVDLRGRGRSEITPPGTYGLDSHAQDILEVADQLGCYEFDVVGWSLGALIAMRVAAQRRARLRTVTLIDHAGPSNPAALIPVGLSLDRLGAAVSDPATYLRAIRDTGPIDAWSSFWDAHFAYELERRPDGKWTPTTSRAAAGEDMYRLWRSDWAAHWRELKMPTALVRAMRPINGALFVTDQTVRALMDANPAIRVSDLPLSNHYTCMVDPNTVAAIKNILGDHTVTGSAPTLPDRPDNRLHS
jgi:pimeloyl-ACP methyl ester carboxylesterase